MTDSSGFSVGVLRIEWVPEPSYGLPGQPGRVWPAQIFECHTQGERLLRDVVNAALRGVVVRAPDGVLSVVKGVESPATMSLFVGIKIGLWLVSMEEP